MLESFDYRLATRVVFGAGSIERLAELTREIGSAESLAPDELRTLVVSDPGIVAAGHVQRGLDALAAGGISAVLFDGAAENPTTRHVEAGVEFARRHGINFIVGLGGGSAMDCAKGINFVYTNGGRMADYWGIGKAGKPMLPLMAVPTTAGTGSEAQSFALIADEHTHQKMACGDRKAAARAAILDPELTTTQPAAVTAATGLDAVAHAVESYACTKANAMSRLFAGRAWKLLTGAFERVMRDGGDLHARGDMLLGAHFAGVSIENSMLGAAHAAANPLTAMHAVTHGVAVGLMLPHVVRFNAVAAESIYNELIGAGGSRELLSVLERLGRASGIPTRLRELSVPRESIPALAAMAARQWTAGFNPRPIGETDFVNLYEQAW